MNDTTANYLLTRGFQYERSKCQIAAKYFYKEGLKELNLAIQSETNHDVRQELIENQRECQRRLLKITANLNRCLEGSKMLENIKIRQNSTGHNYESLFGTYMTKDTYEIKLREPYIYKNHQYVNLIRFLELALTKCENLCYVRLKIKKDTKAEEQQHRYLTQIKLDMEKYNVLLQFKYTTKHDRHIILNNISHIYDITLQRGLDIFQRLDNTFAIGYIDPKFRKCEETTMKICESQVNTECINCTIL